MLYHKLTYAIELVDAAIGSKQEESSLRSVLAKRGPIRRLYFAFSLKHCLQKTMDDLEKWHKMFDPTWYLICRIRGPIVDSSLQQHAEAKSVSVLKGLRFAAGKQHQLSDYQPRQLLDARVLMNAASTSDLEFGIYWSRLRSGDSVIVNRFTPHKLASLQQTQDEIERLSSTLANVDPKVFGLLQCYGVILHEPSAESYERPHYDLLLTVPPGMAKACSLRARLIQAGSISLTIRLSLAQSLSNAVMFVHSSQFVHKNIRPETILIFESETSTTPTPYLLGFEKFRLAQGETFRIGDSQWESNLYRHPKRQGLWPEEEYNMLHDVYSLGIVLLEIGLWTSFVTYPVKNDEHTETGPDGSVKVAATLVSSTPTLGPMLAPLTKNFNKRDSVRALQTKALLLDLAQNQLPCSMGDKYAQIVLRCLSCLDTDDPGLGDPDGFLDKDDIVVGVEFVENVIMGLYEISC